jgi:hypothetical protein
MVDGGQGIVESLRCFFEDAGSLVEESGDGATLLALLCLKRAIV